MKRLFFLIPILITTQTTRPDLVFHIGWHTPVTATVLHASHNAIPSDGSFSLKWTTEECQKFAVCSLAAIALTAAAYYTYEYMNAPVKEVKKASK